MGDAAYRNNAIGIVLHKIRYFPALHGLDMKLVQNTKMKSVLVLIAANVVVIQ